MKLVIEVSKKQLAQVSRIVKGLNGRVRTIDPVKFLQAMIETDIDDLEKYIGDTIFEGGCNSIGDVLTEEQCADMIVFKKGYDEDDED